MEEVLSRDQVAEQDKWQLEDIYTCREDWDKDYEWAVTCLPDIEKMQGLVGRSSADLLKALQLKGQLEEIIEKLYVYARMKRDEDNNNNQYQILYERAESLSIKGAGAASFIIPEILVIPEAVLDEYRQSQAGLELYNFFFTELLRQKSHILSEKEEKILAMSADLATAAASIFNMFNNADIKFPVITDEEGNETELTKGRYSRFMESRERKVRQTAFNAMYDTYGKMKNTLAAALNSSVKRDIFYARVRRYPSALAAALDQDNVDPSVYDQLIDSVHRHLDKMYRYLELRKKMLEVDELHMYDLYTPLVPEVKVDILYEEAGSILMQGLKPMGDDYLRILEQGLKGRWIDVYENKGKTGGAYSWGTYSTHPYVLLNYDNKLNDVFTLAHEMGHALHSYYSNAAQPYIYSQYSIFLAEVASTVNESLLIDHLIQNTTERRKKMYLLNYYLEQFRGTVFRQTMFAEFEKMTHLMVESGEGLTTDNLCQVYLKLNELYYGPGMVFDPGIALEWARIPHFYSAFYVYKYATGFSAATALKQKILEDGASAVGDYIEFLKAGGSDYPLTILRKTGVDLTTPQPVEAGLNYFGRLLDQLEELVALRQK